ncbi:hypothetical protein NW762_011187 [Fusarium torreyae]|uniref:Uncharacterized protein n=1 Tax=Fusarium torreyae TaxID=1237075 RepID=A0A9W8RTG0_9HYPO|nr:hypothetical protein NW762_011187 [Fusarium torreyae]
MPVLSDKEIHAILDRITALEADVGKLKTEVDHLRGDNARTGHSASQHGAGDSMTDHSRPKARSFGPTKIPTETGGFRGFGNEQTDLNAIRDEMMTADPDIVSVTFEVVPVKKDKLAPRTEDDGYQGVGNLQTDLNAVKNEVMANPDTVGYILEVVPVKKGST